MAAGSRVWREKILLPSVLRCTTLPPICSRMNSTIASTTPTPDAAIRLTVWAVTTTATITTKSKIVERALRKCRLWRSIMRTPTTTRMPASAATGTQAIRAPSARNASSDSAPSISPDRRLFPPLEMFTRVAPICPAPGMPPMAAEARLPSPCPRSSRFESCRLRVSVSTTTQVLSVSIESSTARVSAGISRAGRSARPIALIAVSRPAKALKRPDPPPPSGPMTCELPARTRSAGSAQAKPP